MTEICSAPGCEKVLPHNPRRKGTLCRSCHSSALGKSPEKRAKCAAAMKARLADPAERKRMADRCRAGWQRALEEKPELRARLIEVGRRVGRLQKGNDHRPAGSASRRAAAVKQSQHYLGWCPLEYRDEYRRLVKNSGMIASQARAVIEQQIETDRRRYLATGRLQASVSPKENNHV